VPGHRLAVLLHLVRRVPVLPLVLHSPRGFADALMQSEVWFFVSRLFAMQRKCG
jgi:hypothetical protein